MWSTRVENRVVGKCLIRNRVVIVMSYNLPLTWENMFMLKVLTGQKMVMSCCESLNIDDGCFLHKYIHH